jgi:hypothetical protein
MIIYTLFLFLPLPGPFWALAALFQGREGGSSAENEADSVLVNITGYLRLRSSQRSYTPNSCLPFACKSHN